jgi:hypothetical protein
VGLVGLVGLGCPYRWRGGRPFRPCLWFGVDGCESCESCGRVVWACDASISRPRIANFDRFDRGRLLKLAEV